jgi:hypothetical protein
VIGLLTDALEESKVMPMAEVDSERHPARTGLAPRIGTQSFYMGDQSRVNMASEDRSTNTIQPESSVFVELRELLEGTAMSAAERQSILQRLDALEAAAPGSQQFLTKYQEFVAGAANHVTVLAPYLPALTALLTR